MPYWQLFYHIFTATRDRKPLITPSAEPILYAYLKEKCYDLEGMLYAINGTEDHVHILVAIPPKIAVASFIGQIKGYASSQYNQNNPKAGQILWQAEYGAFSLDKKRLPSCAAYIEGQKAHHQQGTLIPVLERTTPPDEHQLAEPRAAYLTDDDFADPF